MVAAAAGFAAGGNAVAQTIDPEHRHRRVSRNGRTSVSVRLSDAGRVQGFCTTTTWTRPREPVAPFNQLHNEARVFTPGRHHHRHPQQRDTPHSLVQLGSAGRADGDLPAEIEKNRYDVQLTDMYRNNLRVHGQPHHRQRCRAATWSQARNGGQRRSLKSVFWRHRLPFTIFHTQLFNAADANVQSAGGLRWNPCRSFLGQGCPGGCAGNRLAGPDTLCIGLTSPKYLNFLSSHRCPPFRKPNRSCWPASRRSG